MTGEQFMKRASVVIIGASIVLAVWWKTEPAAEREKRGVILPAAATAEEFTHEQETGEKGLFEALQGEPETDGGDARGRDSEGGQDLRGSVEVHGRYAGGAAAGSPGHDGADGGVNESSASEEAGNDYDIDAERADLEGHKAYLDPDTCGTVTAILDPQGQTDQKDVPIAASSDESAGVTHEPAASEEASEEAARRAGNISHDNKDGLFVLGEVAEDMPADETAQDFAEVGGKIQSDGTGSTSGQLYSVNRAVLSPYLQEYLYGQLARYGCEWFYPIALCQIYQESRFRSDAVNPNGLDKGLCQFREQYWEYHARLSGLYEYDIWNPIDQLWVYAWLMSENLRKSGGDVGMALSRYYLGEATYCEKYVGDVMQWMQTMEVR